MTTRRRFLGLLLRIGGVLAALSVLPAFLRRSDGQGDARRPRRAFRGFRSVRPPPDDIGSSGDLLG